jgi:hypothetical protein
VTWGAINAAGTVTVKASNTCGLSAGTNSQSFSSVCREEGEGSTATVFSVYPNPAHYKITVSVDVKKDSDFMIKLSDLAGRVILSENQSAFGGLNTYELNLSNLSKGIYVLEITSVPGASGERVNWKSKVAVE